MNNMTALATKKPKIEEITENPAVLPTINNTPKTTEVFKIILRYKGVLLFFPITIFVFH